MNDDDVKYLRAKVDAIADSLASTNVILERNTVSLEEHMRRTNILETQVKENETRIAPLERQAAGLSFLVKAGLALIPALALAHSLNWI